MSSSRRLVGSLLLVVLALSSCAIESPIAVTDRPLAERLENRRAESTLTPEVINTGETFAPQSLAFSEALADGSYLKLHITNEGVPALLRAGPGPSYDQLSEVPSGAGVFATGNQTGQWVHVVYADFEGWVTAQRITFDEVPGDGEQLIAASDVDRSPVTYVVVGEAIGVNIRAEANASSELVSGAAVGSRVVGTGNTKGSWIEVTFEGVTGWASGNYLEPVGSVAAAPPASVEPAQNTDE